MRRVNGGTPRNLPLMRSPAFTFGDCRHRVFPSAIPGACGLGMMPVFCLSSARRARRPAGGAHLFPRRTPGAGQGRHDRRGGLHAGRTGCCEGGGMTGADSELRMSVGRGRLRGRLRGRMRASAHAGDFCLGGHGQSCARLFRGGDGSRMARNGSLRGGNRPPHALAVLPPRTSACRRPPA